MDRSEIARLLTDARARTLLLIAPLDAEDIQVQHSPLMSPIVWDLGHIAHFEELWLVSNIGPDPEGRQFGEIAGMYNPFENPRSVRGEMELPTLEQSLEAMGHIRRKVLAHLERVDLDADDPLLRDGYVFNMVLQHEYQHNETILQTVQLKKGAPYAAPRGIEVPLSRDAPSHGDSAPPADSAESTNSGGAAAPGGMVRFDGGEVVLGTDDRSAAYDNERPARPVHVDAFEIDATPVTNAAYMDFIQDGGYRREELWSDAGREWLKETRAVAPQYWTREGNRWQTRSMNRTGPVAGDHPVCHVTYHEAEAFARWAGKRLPSEEEWETAASWDPSSRTKRRYPWGDDAPTPLHANLDQLAFGTAPVGAYPRNVSPIGCHGMIGDVWEWTSSDFRPWPGYETFPYKEYSEVFFGDEYKVLRGGSWATRPGAIRATFRNWDFPIRRQIFSGFRCARGV